MESKTKSLCWRMDPRCGPGMRTRQRTVDADETCAPAIASHARQPPGQPPGFAGSPQESDAARPGPANLDAARPQRCRATHAWQHPALREGSWAAPWALLLGRPPPPGQAPPGQPPSWAGPLLLGRPLLGRPPPPGQAPPGQAPPGQVPGRSLTCTIHSFLHAPPAPPCLSHLPRPAPAPSYLFDLPHPISVPP